MASTGLRRTKRDGNPGLPPSNVEGQLEPLRCHAEGLRHRGLGIEGPRTTGSSGKKGHVVLVAGLEYVLFVHMFPYIGKSNPN